ncbi:50S ribosomal protein L24 [Actinospica sp. MGRD01-02]|uniref:Large ribosomal subunit protein uL24 n=1 Tax=Actinospica acidithermotolerans TaxID=2828514 RepID=A0A941IHN5_9ACTN|nr:50S ribosomal protein L24 [Actinospica acidithermotolerans]MBR7825358.1 50S ribosomal protein L24 [Actinospica acidithermotolerans]
MAKQKIRKGDLVQVIAGKDKGLQGKVIQSLPRDGKVIVEGVNRVKKHTKVGQTARGSQTGGIITTEAPIQVSNVMLVVEHEGKKVVTRVGFRREEQERTLPDGSKKTVTRSVRFAKKTGEAI